jgi:signal transduction histidine kinase/ligand-binding sensor domain-containing protein
MRSRIGRIAVGVSLGLIAHAAVAERLPVRRYTSADGLAQDQVLSVRADRQGFLWFGTMDGLSRFDGETFRSYGMRNGLSSATVLSLLETSDGTLWAGTADGLCRFLPDGPPERLFTCQQLGTTVQSRSIGILFEDHRGTLWAGTGDGLYSLTGRDRQPHVERLGLSELQGKQELLEVGALTEDRDGCLWIGSMFGIARRCDQHGIQVFRLQPLREDNNRVFGLITDRGGRVWAALAYDGVLVFMPGGPGWEERRDLFDLATPPENHDPGRRLALPVRPGQVLHLTSAQGLSGGWVRGGIWSSSDGTIWMGTGTGLSRFDGERIVRLSDSTEPISFVGTEDRAGNLWFGTENAGALRLNAQGFVSFNGDDGLPIRTLRGIFVTPSGGVTVVAHQDTFYRFDDHGFSAVSAPIPAAVDRGWSFHQSSFQDSQGEWWIATAEGLWHFASTAKIGDLAREKPLAVYTAHNGLGGTRVFRLFEDSHHDLWISTLNAPQLSRWRRATGTIDRYALPLVPHGDPPTAFVEDRMGSLWMGFYHGGLARYRDGHFTWYPPNPDGIPAGWVSDLAVDHAGRLWVSSLVSGVTRIDDPAASPLHLHHYTSHEGVSSDLIYATVEDLYHRVYICGGRGVDRLDSETGSVAHLSTADGLANLHVLAAARDGKGDLWFVTASGLSRLSPHPSRVAQAPASLLTALRVDGRGQPIPELGGSSLRGLALRPGDHQLEISFAAIGSEFGEVTRYQHRLNGDASRWTAPARENRVVYEALMPGTYDFLVRALSSDGRPGAPAELSFRVLPPWWKQSWLLVLALAVASAAAYSSHRIRVSHLLSLERVRIRLATDLHDDLGASLSRIALLSEVAAREMPGSAERSRTVVGEIGSLARELFDSTADIVWAIDPRRDDLGSLVVRLSEYARDVLAAQNATWALKTPHHLESVSLSADCRREIFLLLKEAVHNTARHSGATEVTLSLELVDDRLRAEVADNGRGFEMPESGTGDGLRNMTRRAEALRGTAAVVSAPGEGTKVRIDVQIHP